MGNWCSKSDEENVAKKDKYKDTDKEGKSGGNAKDREPASSSSKPSKGGPPPGKMQMSWERLAIQDRPHRPTRQPFAQLKEASDYEAEKLKDTAWVRYPGQVHDQRVTIDCCENVNFCIIDQVDSVQVDECKNCTFFIGPTLNSVFIRDCVDCCVVVACGQLRLRGCKNCKLSLYSRSRPVIESSTRIGFGCFSGVYYFELQKHFCDAQLSVFNNLYSHVHDFTPKKVNHYFLKREEAASLIPPLSTHAGSYISAEEEEMLANDGCVVPYTLGGLDIDTQKYSVPVVVIFKNCGLDAALTLLRDLEQRTSAEGPEETTLILRHTYEHRFTPELLSELGKSVPSLQPLFESNASSLVGPCVCLAFSVSSSSAGEDARTSLISFLNTESRKMGKDEKNIALSVCGGEDLGVEKSRGKEEIEQLIETLFLKLPMVGSGFGSGF